MNPVWTVIKNLFSWAWAHKNMAVYIILAIVIMILSWQNNRHEENVARLSTEKGVLEDRLKNQLTVKGNTVTFLAEDKKDNVVKFVPREGGVTVSETKDGKTELNIDNWGFTVKPGFGAYYTGDFEGVLDMKLFYYDRWSSGVGSSLTGPNVWVSRHIDDLVPVLKPENVELSMGYGRLYDNFEHSVFLVGLRTNF
jgi:hypothetical protein